MPHGIKRREVRRMLNHADELLMAIMRDGKNSLTGEFADRAQYVSFASYATLEAYLRERVDDHSYPHSAERLAEVAYGFALDTLADLVKERGL